MFFPFECKNCKKDKWTIRYDSENKEHQIQCVNCGVNEILEDIFGKRRAKKNAKKTNKKSSIEKITKSTKDTISNNEEVKQITKPTIKEIRERDIQIPSGL